MTAQSWDELDTVAWGELRHNYGTATDVPGLLRACAGQDVELAAEAIWKLDSAVFHQGGWICPAAPAALPFLVKLAADPASGIRVEVIELITSLAREATLPHVKQVDPAWRPALDAATPALLGLLSDSAATVRRAAVYLAGNGGLNAERALSALRTRLRTEPETGIRYDIIVSMAAAVAVNRESGAARDVQRELTAMAAPGTEDLQLRLAAVHGLAELGEPAKRHLPLLIRAVTDPGAARWADSAWFGPAASGLVAGTGALLAEHPTIALEYSVGVSQRGDAAKRRAAIDRVAVLVLWRITGDATAAVPVLAALTEPLSEGKYLPVALVAMRCLAGIPGAAALAPEVTETARAVLANPRRLASSGAWRAFTEDDDIRAAAEFVTS